MPEKYVLIRESDLVRQWACVARDRPMPGALCSHTDPHRTLGCSYRYRVSLSVEEFTQLGGVEVVLGANGDFGSYRIHLPWLSPDSRAREGNGASRLHGRGEESKIVT